MRDATAGADRVPGMDRDEMLEAAMARDHRYDGRFILAVASTRIYCKPSCPARKPLARNVRFFATNEEARRAGFRACLRCRPDAPPGEPTADALLVERVRARVERDPSEARAEVLAAEEGVSASHLRRAFRRHTGGTLAAYARRHRTLRAADLLEERRALPEVARDAGFGSTSAFYATFRRLRGTTPRAFQRRRSAPEPAKASKAAKAGEVAEDA